MAHLEYCSGCGACNDVKVVDGRSRHVCPRCGTVHYENPRPAVTVIAVRDGQLLLVKRAVPPAAGEWCLPGGFMELAESVTEAARRELLEETGLEAAELSLLGICPFPGSIRGDVLVIGLVAKAFSGDVTPADDALDARFYPFNDRPPMAFRCHEALVQNYLDAGQDGRQPTAGKSG